MVLTQQQQNPHPAVEVQQLTRRFGDFVAIDNVDLTVARGELFSLLGPSGCGKTTLLRIIAGLEIADTGVLRIAGADVRSVAAHRRPVNTVFQSYALFPHLSVADNVAFGLRMKKVSPAEVEPRVKRAMEMVQITQHAAKKPAQLSGGQKQRVALARALVNEPEVLLLDEPMGALDLKLKKELQLELKALQRRLGITFINVTHDQEEALVMSDRIAVMRAGKIEQLGTPSDLYEHPRTRFVSQFLGSCNIFDGSPDGDRTVRTAIGPLKLAIDPSGRATAAVAIRPEKIRLLPHGGGVGENDVEVVIEQRIYIGAETQWVLRAGAQQIFAHGMNTDASSAHFDIGQRAIAHLPAPALLLLEG